MSAEHVHGASVLGGERHALFLESTPERSDLLSSEKAAQDGAAATSALSACVQIGRANRM